MINEFLSANCFTVVTCALGSNPLETGGPQYPFLKVMPMPDQHPLFAFVRIKPAELPDFDPRRPFRAP